MKPIFVIYLDRVFEIKEYKVRKDMRYPYYSFPSPTGYGGTTGVISSFAFDTKKAALDSLIEDLEFSLEMAHDQLEGLDV